MYNPTKPGYSTQNQTNFTPNYELTVPDNPYASSPYDLQNIPIPPKPPHELKKVLLVLGMIIVILLVVISGLVVGLIYVSNGKAPMNQVAATRTLSTQAPSPVTTNYTAKSVLNDLADSGQAIEVVSYEQDEVAYLNQYYPQLNNQIEATSNDKSLLSSVTFYDCTNAIPLSSCGNDSNIPPDWLGVYTSTYNAHIAYQETASINTTASPSTGTYPLTSSSGNMYNTWGRCLIVGYDAASPKDIAVLQNSCV